MEMDDFDFKPITKGLGFDKKAEETKPTPSPIPPSLSFTEKVEAPVKPEVFEKSIDWNMNPPKTSRMISDMLSSLPPAMDFSPELPTKPAESKVQMPIGRADYMPAPAPTTGYNKSLDIPKVNPEDPDLTKEGRMDVSLNNTLEKAFPKVGFRRPFFHQTVEVQPQYTPVTSSFTSAILDLLVISGLTALMLVGIILLTKVDLIAVIMHTSAPLSVWLEIGAIFFGVYTLYYMCTRGLWGNTLGDWAFDIQLGLEEERMQWYYPAQVVFRMTVIALTGFVIFPLISFLFKKDLGYWISGLRLYSRNY
jgi:hypothetical protein